MFTVGQLLRWLLRYVLRPLSFLNRWALLPLISSLYRRTKRTQEVAREKWSTRRIVTTLLPYRPYVVRALVILVTFVVMRTNLLASDTSSAQSPNTNILFTIIRSVDTSDLIEDATPAQPMPEKNVSYLDPSATLDPALLEILETDQESNDSEETTDVARIDEATVQGIVILPGNAYGVNTRQVQQYTVVDGDTVGKIAQQFGVSINTLIWENKLGGIAFIKPGQVLRVLPVNGVSYAVKAGDTLQSIAKRTGGEVETIMAFNDLTAEQLQIGETLIVPDGVIAAPPRSRSTYTLARDILLPSQQSTAQSVPGKLLWPTAVRRITQYFTWRHSGLDIAGPKGTPVYAAEDGRVVLSGWNRGGYGLQVVVGHDKGMLTRYAHLNTSLVKPNQTIEKGQVIGLMGSTGRSTGSHLHFEVIQSGRRLNPLRSL